MVYRRATARRGRWPRKSATAVRKSALRTRPTAGNQRSQIVRLSSAVSKINHKLSNVVKTQFWFQETATTLEYTAANNGFWVRPLLAPRDSAATPVYSWVQQFHNKTATEVDWARKSKGTVKHQKLDLSFSCQPTSTESRVLMISYDVYVVTLKPAFKTLHSSGVLAAEDLVEHSDYEDMRGGQIFLNPSVYTIMAHRRFTVGNWLQASTVLIEDMTKPISKTCRISLRKDVLLSNPGDAWNLLSNEEILATKQRYLLVHSTAEQATMLQEFSMTCQTTMAVSD